MLETTPLAAAGYIHYFPTSLLHETSGPLPILFSPTSFSDALPAEIMEFYRGSATVRSVQATSQGRIVQQSLERGRRISIVFGDDRRDGFGYDLLMPKVTSFDEATLRLKLEASLPSELPSQEYFENWVRQSIHQSARAHFSMLAKDVNWAAQCGAFYLTESEFCGNLLATCDPCQHHSIEEITARGTLELDLPFFAEVDFSSLMKARADEEAFSRFRILLEKHFREIRLEPDETKRLLKAENAMHELFEVQRAEVEATIKRLNRKLFLGAATGAFGLVASILSPSSTLSAISLALAGFATIDSYRQDRKANPAYFLTRAARKRR